MRRKQAHGNWSLRIAGILLCLVLVTAQLMSGMLARYITDVGQTADTTAAGFAFTAQGAGGTLELDLSEVRYPGTSASFPFTVSDQNGAAVSEVALRVTAQVATAGDLPLTVTLTEQGTDAPILYFDMAEDSGGTVELTCFDSNTAHSQTYVLTVEWPAERSDISLMEQTAQITLSVTAEQID